MEITDVLLQVVTKWSKDTENKMKKILSRTGKGNSNIFRQLHLILNIKEGKIQITTKLPDYYIFVDKGRRPGKQPPLKTIQDWCKSKNIPKKAAFPIARKIGERGIKPTNFMDPMYQFQQLISDLKLQTVQFIQEDIKSNIKN